MRLPDYHTMNFSHCTHLSKLLSQEKFVSCEEILRTQVSFTYTCSTPESIQKCDTYCRAKHLFTHTTCGWCVWPFPWQLQSGGRWTCCFKSLTPQWWHQHALIKPLQLHHNDRQSARAWTNFAPVDNDVIAECLLRISRTFCIDI